MLFGLLVKSFCPITTVAKITNITDCPSFYGTLLNFFILNFDLFFFLLLLAIV